MLKALYFKKIVVIYDNSVDNMLAMTFFERSLAYNNILMLNSMLITKNTRIDSLALKLESFKSTCSAFVVLSGQTNILDTVFDAAFNADMLGEAFSWVIFSGSNDGYFPLFSLKRPILFVNPRRQQWRPRDLINDAVFLSTRGFDNMAESLEKQECSCRCECQPFTNQLYRYVVPYSISYRHYIAAMMIKEFAMVVTPLHLVHPISVSYIFLKVVCFLSGVFWT